MYWIIVEFPDGQKESYYDVDAYSLWRALDKCEIKSFKVQLQPISDK